jgi:hypothetical protein
VVSPKCADVELVASKFIFGSCVYHQRYAQDVVVGPKCIDAEKYKYSCTTESWSERKVSPDCEDRHIAKNPWGDLRRINRGSISLQWGDLLEIILSIDSTGRVVVDRDF